MLFENDYQCGYTYIDHSILLLSIVNLLVIPFLWAFIVRKVLLTLKNERWLEEKILPKVSVGQFIFLLSAITAMFASQGETLVSNPTLLLKLLPPIAIFFTIIFSLDRVSDDFLSFPMKTLFALTSQRLRGIHRYLWLLRFRPFLTSL